MNTTRLTFAAALLLLISLMLLPQMILAQDTGTDSSATDSERSARQVRKRLKGSEDKLSSDEIEFLLKELASKLKAAKEREAVDSEEQKKKQTQQNRERAKKLQAEIKKLETQQQQVQQKLMELQRQRQELGVPMDSTNAPQDSVSSEMRQPVRQRPMFPPTGSPTPALPPARPDSAWSGNQLGQSEQVQDRYAPMGRISDSLQSSRSGRRRRTRVASPQPENIPPQYVQPSPPPASLNLSASVASQSMTSQSMLSVAQMKSVQPASLSLSQDKLATYPATAEGNLISPVQMSTLRTGYGLSYIDGQQFYAVSVAPELVVGNFAMGFDATIRIGEDGQIRQEDWKDFNSVLQAIRYVRYSSDLKGLFGMSSGTGSATEPSSVFLRVGQLDNVTLGTGALMQNYRNNSAFDERKTGIEFKLMSRDVTLEAMTSNLAKPEIFGGRFSFRNSSANDAAGSASLLRQIELGATVIADVSPNARLIAPLDATNTPVLWQGSSSASGLGESVFSEAGAKKSIAVGVAGADVKVKLVNEPTFSFVANAEYAKTLQSIFADDDNDDQVVNYTTTTTTSSGSLGSSRNNIASLTQGSGGMADVQLTWRSKAQAAMNAGASNTGMVEGTVTLRHLVNGNGYRPIYFDAFYEQERYEVVGTDALGNKLVRTRANSVSNNGANNNAANGSIYNGYNSSAFNTSASLNTGNSFFVSGRFGYEGKVKGNAIGIGDGNGSGSGNVNGGSSFIGQREACWIEGSYTNTYQGSQNRLLYLGIGVTSPVIGGYFRYYKQGVTGGNIFKGDEGTMAVAEVTVRFSEQVMLGLNYNWTFKPIYDTDGTTVINYQPEQRLEPKVNIRLKF